MKRQSPVIEWHILDELDEYADERLVSIFSDVERDTPAAPQTLYG